MLYQFNPFFLVGDLGTHGSKENPLMCENPNQSQYKIFFDKGVN